MKMGRHVHLEWLLYGYGTEGRRYGVRSGYGFLEGRDDSHALGSEHGREHQVVRQDR